MAISGSTSPKTSMAAPASSPAVVAASASSTSVESPSSSQEAVSDSPKQAEEGAAPEAVKSPDVASLEEKKVVDSAAESSETSQQADENEEPAFVDASKKVGENERRWNPKHFGGEFTDSLGHSIYTVEDPTKRSLAFRAHFIKRNIPDKQFVVAKQRMGQNNDGSIIRRWMCGNGLFQTRESSFDKIVWRAEDGRENIWTRVPPSGPVYFDPPPHLKVDVEETVKTMMEQMKKARETAAANPEAGKDQDLVSSEAGETTATVLPKSGAVVKSSMVGNGPSKPLFSWKADVPAFIPQALKERMPTIQGENKSIVIQSDGTLNWTLEDSWVDLKMRPKDFGVVSPQFDLGEIKNMQLTFFPSGRKAAEYRGCSIQFSTGTLPSSKGIKFEFVINGLSTGPKVVVGARFTGDYPPLDDKRTEKVTIGLRIEDVFSEKNYDKK